MVLPSIDWCTVGSQHLQQINRDEGSDIDVYSAIEKTLLRAKIAVKTKDQNTPAVPPLTSPGVRDLRIVSMSSSN